MLQWVASDGVAFNTWEGGAPVTRVVRNAGSTSLEGHTCAVSGCGTLALGYSFTRLRRGAAAYGYWDGLVPGTDDEAAPVDDGLLMTELSTGRRRLVTSLAELASGVGSAFGGYHFVTHATFNPSVTRLACYHRWKTSDGLLRTHLRIATVDGVDVLVAPVANPSHYCWDSDDAVGITDSDSGGACYSHWDLGTKVATAIMPIALPDDGHPQRSPVEPWRMVTDTYPNRFRRQSLLLVDRRTGGVRYILEEHVGLSFRGERRCDYHPRWSPDGRQVCVDTAGTGIRSLAILDLTAVLASLSTP